MVNGVIIKAMKNLNQFVESDVEKMSGEPVFVGTRVPLQNLFDYLQGGDSVEMFLDHFPTVERRQVIGVLEALKERVYSEVRYEIAA